MTIKKFKTIYEELTDKNDMIFESSTLNKILAGTALAAGTLFGGLNANAETNQQNYEVKDRENTNWVKAQTIPFIQKFEGRVLDEDGNHVLYDDNINAKVTRKWDGKGGKAGIQQFIKSCIGKPTIGYGETSPEIIIKGKLSESEAYNLLLIRVVDLNNYLNKTIPIYKKLNSNQKTGLLSFTYNLGKYFIERKAPKMRGHLNAGRLNLAWNEMRDCDRTTIKGRRVKSKALGRRRAEEIKLCKTPM